MSKRNQVDERKQRLQKIIRKLANMHTGRQFCMLIDLSCSLDLSGPIDEARLPVKPDGFMLKQATIRKYTGLSLVTLCQLQIVSMAVLYHWLHISTGDPQDARSCERYCAWLEDYVEASQKYGLVNGEHMQVYLYRRKGTDDEVPQPPEWLHENEGETV